MRTFKLSKCKRIGGLHFSSDGRGLLVVGGAEAARVDTAVWLDPATWAEVGRVTSFVAWYAVPPDLSRIVIADEPGVAWTTLPGGGEWHLFPGRTKGKRGSGLAFGNALTLAFDPTGTLLAVGHGREDDDDEWVYEVTVARFDSPELVARFDPGCVSGVLAFDATGTRIAVAGCTLDRKGVVRVFDLPAGKRVCEFRPPGIATHNLVFAADGRLFVANGRSVYVLPPGRAEPQFTLGGHKGQVNAVAVSPGGRRVVTASHDGAVRVWDAGTGRELRAFDWAIGHATAAAFAPDGLTCAVGGDKGQVVVWDVDE